MGAIHHGYLCTRLIDFVHDQAQNASDGYPNVMTPSETIYEIDNELKHCVDMDQEDRATEGASDDC